MSKITSSARFQLQLKLFAVKTSRAIRATTHFEEVKKEEEREEEEEEEKRFLVKRDRNGARPTFYVTLRYVALTCYVNVYEPFFRR